MQTYELRQALRIFRREPGLAAAAVVTLALVQVKESLAGFEALATADLSNAAATNDLAIGIFKVGALLESMGRRREALPEFERALRLHLGLRAADPGNEAVAAQLASDYNGLATAQAKLGMRRTRAGQPWTRDRHEPPAVGREPERYRASRRPGARAHRAWRGVRHVRAAAAGTRDGRPPCGRARL